jgi:bifunctional UDP-N-acetylglucosamine pyrophosphorylase/glucosamine-1-phosphate N-acetyltransferase
LFSALERLQPSNAQGEFTDGHRADGGRAGRRVAAVQLEDPHEGLGVNTRRQLAEAEQVSAGDTSSLARCRVRMIDPASAWIDAGVTIGKDSVLYRT